MTHLETEARIHQLLADRGAPMVLATVVAAEGSSPGKPGFKLLLLADGTTLGTVGGGKIEQLVIEEARTLLDGGGQPGLRSYDLTEKGTGMWCGGRATVFLEPILPHATLWLFGFGHLGQEVHLLARRLGFAVRILHEKPLDEPGSVRFDWSSLEPFPEVRAADFVLLLTKDATQELAVIERLAIAPPRYIGLVGSRTKGAKMRQRLEEKGLASVARVVRVPVGLPIGAVTEEEIAVSIAAELVRERSGGVVPGEETA